MQDSKLPKVKKDITLHIQNAPFYEKYALIFKFVIPITLLLLIVGIIVLGWIVRPRFHRKALLYYEWDQEVAKDWLYQSEPELLKINGGNIILVFRIEQKERLCNPLRL